jgi:hypothetical protein
VGGVSGRAGRRPEGEILPRCLPRQFFACRDGGRHPGRQEGGALRGASSEWRPRFGPSCGSGSSTLTDAPTTADVRRTPRRGTSSAYAVKKRVQPAQARVIVAGDEETRPSLGSSTRARQSPLCSAAQASEVGRSRRHHGWASSGRLERNQHWGRGGRTERGSPPVTVLVREAA